MVYRTLTPEEAEMSVDPQQLRITMRLWTSGVTVVTAALNGKRAGVTASSFTSVSLNPPLILVCLYKNTEIAHTVIEAGHFAVSILGEGQSEISEQFAGHNRALPKDADRFYNIATSSQITGAPILTDAIAWVDCQVHAAHDGGTHWIIVGEVLAAGRRDDDPKPLVYYNRAYRSITS